MKIVDMNGHEWWDPVADLTAAANAVASTVTSVASAVTNTWNSLPPIVSSVAQSTANYIQSTIGQMSQSVSAGLSGMSDVATRTISSISNGMNAMASQVANSVSSAYSYARSGYSSLSLIGSDEPIVKTVSQYATSPALRILGGASLIFIGVFRMATPFLNGGGPNEPVPTTDSGIDAIPPPSNDFNIGPKPGFLSDLLQSEIEGAALVIAGSAMEFSGSYQLGCETSGRCAE